MNSPYLHHFRLKSFKANLKKSAKSTLMNILLNSRIFLTGGQIAQFYVPSGITLDVNFGTFNLTVKSGSSVLIESGGTIT